MEGGYQKLLDKYNALWAANSQLDTNISTIQSTPTTAVLDATFRALLKEVNISFLFTKEAAGALTPAVSRFFKNNDAEGRLQILRKGAALIPEGEKARIDKDFKSMNRACQERRKIRENIIKTIAENYPGKMADLLVF
ncbi:hypothetical protein BCR43DRAFT_132900 [Syncephalastrum racemosum]|uniref:Uncharacterized protein n=1 Tax=Syncephalastrum racemosum TaxID=13706 RepID=A0A1X2HLH1_SYNRA|nr:hypothetical protein BCR43DRAFT_132900 [Syncephalastrum racemosum]